MGGVLVCPFCGASDNKVAMQSRTEKGLLGSKTIYWIKCDCCGAFQSKSFKTQDKAVTAWNKVAEFKAS